MICSFIVVTIGITLSFQLKSVQSWASKQAAKFLSKELNADIRIKSLYFKPFSSLNLQGLFISDQQGDTLLFTQNLDASLDLSSFFKNNITLDKIEFQEAVLNLKTLEDSTSNLKFLLEYFSPAQKTGKRKIELNLKEVDLKNLRFSYLNFLKTPLSQRKQINFNDISASQINIKLSNIDLRDDGASFRLENLQLKEKTGFEINNFQGQVFIDPNNIQVSDLNLNINKSFLNDYIHLAFQNWGDFNDFINKVNMEWKSTESFVSSSDIEFFSQEIEIVKFDTEVSGRFSGTVSSLFGENVHLKLGNLSELNGNVSVQGLPNIQNTWIEADLQDLKTDILDIEKLTQGFSNNSNFDLPFFLDGFENVEFEGKFAGLYHDFHVDGILLSELGNIQTDLQIRLNEDIHYSGRLSSDNFLLGAIAQIPDLNDVEFEGFVDGKNFTVSQIEGEFDFEFPALTYSGRGFQNISLKGSYKDRNLLSEIQSRDANLNFNSESNFHFLKDSVEIASQGILHHINLEKIPHIEIANLIIKDLNFDLQAFLENSSLTKGNLKLTDFEILNPNDQAHVNLLDLQIDKEKINLHSDFLQAQVEGEIDFRHLQTFIESTIHQYLPHLGKNHPGIVEQNFQANLELIPSKFWNILDSNLNMGQSSSLFLHVENQENFKLLAQLNEFSYGTLNSGKIRLNSESINQVYSSSLNAEKIAFSNLIEVDSFYLHQNLEQGISYYATYIKLDSLGKNNLDLAGRVQFEKEKIDFNLESAYVSVNEENWILPENLQVTWANSMWNIENFILKNKDQEISARGWISKSANQPLSLVFKNFNIANLNAFLSKNPIQFEGILNGNAEIHNVLKDPYAQSDLQVKNFTLNQKNLGLLSLNADLDQSQEKINVNFNLNKNNINTLTVQGHYNYTNNLDPVALNARYESLDISILETFIGDLSDKIQGNVTGNATLTGTLLQPKINGFGMITGGKFRVNYLNTEYNLTGRIETENTALKITNMTVFDRFSNRATVNGRVDLNKIQDPFIDLQVQAQNFHVLNTGLRDNPLYYGTAFGTGNISFQGRSSALNIEIQAKTDDRTEIFIPLNYSSNLVENEFIRFNKKTEDSSPNIEKTFNPGLMMNMELLVNPSADIKITTDLGELSGKGEGNLAMKISSLGDFEMFGDYKINTGNFNFSAQDFINKNFEIKQGGSIRWTGRPSEAQINLIAFYEQRTNVSALYNAAGRPANEQRVLAQAEMLLNGNLLRPNISFGLNFPQDPYIKDELLSYLSDVNNVNQQALSLIVRRSFTPTSSSDFSRELNSTLLGAGTEIAFNQLNNILSESLNLNFVDFQIRSLNDASASFRLFQDKLIISGGITDRRNENINDFSVFSNRIATDAELRYLIWNDGRLVLRAANKLNTRHFLLNPTDEYISSFGLIYRKEFNSFNEFFDRLILNRIKNRKKQED